MTECYTSRLPLWGGGERESDRVRKNGDGEMKTETRRDRQEGKTGGGRNEGWKEGVQEAKSNRESQSQTET